MFTDFQNLTLEELESHKKLRAHGTRAFYAIASMVDCLDDLDIAARIMKKTVDNHYPRGISYTHISVSFRAFRDLILSIVGKFP